LNHPGFVGERLVWVRRHLFSCVLHCSKKVMRALGGRPVNPVVEKWMPMSATP